MTNEAIWTVVAEAYVVHFMMFNCGLEPDDVFVGADRIVNAPTGDPYAFVSARKNGKEFLFWIAPLPLLEDAKEFRKAWLDFCRRQPQLDVLELDELVVRSQAYRQFPKLRQGLIDKGLIDESAGTDALAAWTAIQKIPLEDGLTGEVPS